MYAHPRFYKIIIALLTIGFIIVYALTIANYTVILNEQESEINDLKKKINELDDVRLVLSRRVINLSTIIFELNNTLNELEKIKKELETNNTRLNKRINELEYEIAKLRLDIDSLRKIVELRENKSLAKLTMFTLEYRENRTFNFRLTYSGYILLRINTEDYNVVLKINVRGNYSNYIYTYEQSLNIAGGKASTILPVLPGYVEVVIINNTYKPISILEIDIVYVY